MRLLRRARGFIALAVLCTAVGGFLKLPEAVQTPGSDSGMFATYGRMLLAGGRPYVHFWDVHPPLVYFYWAFVELLTGADWLTTCLAVDSLAPQPCLWLGVHALDLLLSVATALVAAAVAHELGASWPTSALAAVLVVGFADQSMLSQEGSSPAKLTLLPMTFAMWSYLRSLRGEHGSAWLLIAGASAGCAILAKQPAVGALVVLLGHAVWRRDRRAVGWLVVGSAGVLLIACAWLASVGGLVAFVEQAWLYNFERVFSGYWQNPAKPPTIGLQRMLGETAGPLVVSAGLGAAIVACDPRQAGQRFLLWWAVPVALGALVLREYVSAVPPLAVLGAIALTGVWDLTRRLRGVVRMASQALLVVLCVGALRLGTSFQQGQVARAWYERGANTGLSVPEQVGLVIQNEVPPGPIFAYPNVGHAYLLSNRLPATRFLNAEALRKSAPEAEQTRRELVSTLRQNPPPAVVLGPHLDDPELLLAEFPQFGALLAECYAEHIGSQSALREVHDWKLLVRTEHCPAVAQIEEPTPEV